MVVSKNKVVSFHYLLKDDEGKLIDSSASYGSPLTYIQGNGNIIPGLEKAMEGKKLGEKFSVSILPKDAYGEYDANMTMEIPKAHFAGITDTVEVGMQFQINTPHGPQIVTISKVSENMVTLDANHPLAGKTLHFNIDIVGIREATEEELLQGYVGSGCSSDCCCDSEDCNDNNCDCE